MQRRSFLKAGGIALGAGLAADSVLAKIPPHNFDEYDFGGGPTVYDRLYQGPFSADDYPGWSVVMALTASRDVVPNYGMGLITYVCDEVGPAKKDAETHAGYPPPGKVRQAKVCSPEGHEVAGAAAEGRD
jgi:hypothetical protein